MTDLLVEVLSHYGMKEIAGKDSNPEILQFFKDLGYDWVNDDETAWCSAMLSYYAKKCGYEYNKSLGARGWLELPNKIVVLKPTIGDVVVFWRGDIAGWKGHVGLFIAQDINIIYCLGGNQGNQLSISAYPRDQLLGYRSLKKLQP